MDTTDLDQSLATLSAQARKWAQLPIREKLGLLQSCIDGTARAAARQVAAACQAKGLKLDSSHAGEEWLGGPVITLRAMRQLHDSLSALAAGKSPIERIARRTRDDGQVVAEIFPTNKLDGAMYQGFSAELWMEPGVTEANLEANIGEFYRQDAPDGAVALVLGAGNVASIGPLDVVHKLWVEGQVTLLKWNPVNDYLGPFFEEAFAPLFERGYLRSAYGGADVGAYLTAHPSVDEIHITGSGATHDAIVYGVGEDGAQRKSDDRPQSDKRITSELGNVSPVIVVPGAWSDAQLRGQAENIATQLTNNCGFNCNAAKVLVLPEGWALADRLMEALRRVLAELPQRPAYYPGAEGRYDAFLGDKPQAIEVGDRSAGVLPYVLIPDVPASAANEPCFEVEAFLALLAQTSLPAPDVPTYLEHATAFCNDSLYGTLSCCIIVDPNTAKAHADALDQAVAGLRYGSIAINHWPALAYAFGSTAWGAFPGHTLQDIGSGIGSVHNTLLFDKPQKNVVRGPFKPSPKPPWYVTHRRTHLLGPKLVRMEQQPSWFKLPGIVWHALRG
jgi:hypothetical protein